MKKIFAVLLFVIMVSGLILSGCSTQTPSPTSPTTKPPTQAPPSRPVSSPTQAATSKPAQSIISVASMAPGTVTNQILVSAANIVNKYSDVKLNCEPINGPQKYGPLIETGEIGFSTITPSSQKDFYRIANLTAKTSNMRTMAIAQKNYYSFNIRGDRGVTKIEDLAGKKIYMDWPGNESNGMLGTGVLKYYGINDKVTNLAITTPTAMHEGTREGKADGMFCAISTEHTEMKRTCGLVILPTPPDVVKKAFSFEPSYEPGMYPKGYLGVVDETTPNIQCDVMLICSKTLAENDVYTILKTLYNNKAELQTAFRPAADLARLEVPKYPVTPFHPGTVKFYKEMGIWTAEHEALQQKLLQGS